MNFERPGAATCRSTMRVKVLEPCKMRRLRKPVGQRASGPLPTRREFLIGAGSLLLLAPYGCGEGRSETGGEDTADTRTIGHVMGETRVPGSPGRVVVTDRFPLDTALAVEAPLVGVPAPSNLPDYLRERVEGIASIGDEASPSLESIAALDPDLVVGSVFTFEDSYENFSQIAPTVPIDDEDSGRWKEIHAKVSEALGRATEGESVVDRYHARVDEFKRSIEGQTLPEVSVVRPREDGIRLYGKAFFSGLVLEDAGLPRPPAQDVEETEPLDISRELTRKADGDVIFVWSFSPEEREEWQKIKEDPLWNRLRAVQSGRVYEVGAHWYGSGPLAANAILDDLEKYLLEDSSSP